MALRLDENDTDSRLNPGQADYDQKFNGETKNSDNPNSGEGNDSTGQLSDAEQAAAKGGANQSQSLGDQEDSNTGFNSSFTGKNNRNPTKGGFSLRKKGPIGVIIALVFGGAVGFGGLFGGPSLLLVNISEVLQGKFNTAITSLDNRSTKIMAVKIKGTVSGICSNKVSFACKYKSLSADEMKGMERNGIGFKNGDTVISSEDIASGKFKPTSMSFRGEDIPPEQFANKFAQDPAFRTAMQDSMKFNSRFASIGGKVWGRVKKALGISKEDPFANEKAGATDEDRLNAVQEKTSQPVDESNAPKAPVQEGDKTACGQTPCTQEQANELNKANSTANEIAGEARATGASSDTVGALNNAEVAAAEAETGGAGALAKFGSLFKVTGWIDNLCSVYRTIKGVGYAAKIVRYAQLARYAMIFLTTADMIKAGTAKPEDTSYLATTLTQPMVQKDSNGKVTSSTAATDTLAYRNAAFGDTGSLDTLASNYLVAAGLTGALINVSKMVGNAIGGSPAKTCKTLSNPFVSGGSMVVGVALMLTGVGAAPMTLKDVGQAALGITLVAAEMVLPSMLQNIIAGKIIDQNTYGAAAGDALVSGTGALLSTSSQYSGNAPLTPTQAVAYMDEQNKTLARYAEQDRLAYSPLDPTNSNTFAGTIVTQLTRYAGQLSTFGSTVSSIGSFITQSFGAVFKPFAYADDSTAQYTTCQDEDYQKLGLATDLFCNPIRGIPPEYLNNAPDPDVLYEQMFQGGEINEDGTPVAGRQYENTINQCINRDQSVAPLGSTSDTNNIGDGSDCIINNQQTANYYIYWNDQNALDQMENGMVQANVPQPSTTNATTVSSSQLYQSSVNTPCALGTADDGTAQGYYNGQEVDIHLCTVPGTTDSSNSGQPIQVNAVMSANFLALTQAMGQALGSPIKAASSFRTMAAQQMAYASYGPSRAAEPGYSNHQMGLAVDFQLATGNNGSTKAPGTDRVYDWLTANASKYGISQLSTEAWHWQAAGAN